MPERTSKAIAIQLHCIENPEKKGKYDCHQAKPTELDENDYLDPASISKTLIKHQQTNDTSTSILITSIVLTALIGGFGFAVAYILLYILYDWITQPALVVDVVKLVISIVILIGLLTLLVIASYYIIKRGLHTSPQYSFSSPIQVPYEQMGDDPNIRPIPKKND